MVPRGLDSQVVQSIGSGLLSVVGLGVTYISATCQTAVCMAFLLFFPFCALVRASLNLPMTILLWGVEAGDHQIGGRVSMVCTYDWHIW